MSTRQSVKSYHHGNLKTALKKAALKLVRKKGPRGFSLNEASRLAGVTVGAPYRHFADKDALLADLICDGNALLARQIREAVQKVAGVREKMLEAGMAYLHFSVEHADYFLLMFSSGLEKSGHPEVQRSAQDAFSIILDLALQSEPKVEAGQVRAVSAWALVHGLAVLNAEGALDEVIGNNLAIEDLRPVLWDFVTRQSE
ncbi:MAG: TetR/AcrR family transcriptional regulator [Acidobacteriaceae bacterium]|nr:TetR/AcrR family transcriptional regulator [Acidobacteriaceae bacterium]